MQASLPSTPLANNTNNLQSSSSQKQRQGLAQQAPLRNHGYPSSPSLGSHRSSIPTYKGDRNGKSSPRIDSPTPGLMPPGRTEKQKDFIPDFLKIRMLTWNMHDSLPKGDLEELFGKVPTCNSQSAASSIQSLSFQSENIHPYHLIVVAGQECPTPSGIPMGLTAGFKRSDKDREKSKEPDTDKPNHHHHSRTREKEKNDADDDDHHHDTIGWTSMVEDWLCHAGGPPSRAGSPTTADVSHPKPLMRQKSTKDMRRGPYQLLIKERLMGIYMAIYVHRDLKSSVKGMSKSAVTAGLIGGRVGNKGGVGISLNIAGTTFLFLNCHLAAHEGRVNHRLANLSKIKGELEVNDFLEEEDPRKGSEDITDRFDFTFLCGDLNFRLDISRLHADWLISRQEYAQAFAFDQLNNVMKEGKGFEGFQEAPINFPPTFKYDVLRTIKHSKRSNSILSHIGEKSARLMYRESHEESSDDETSSVSSVSGTSVSSQAAGEAGFDSDAHFYLEPTTPSGYPSASKVSVASNAAHHAKRKFISLLSPSISSPKSSKSKHSDSQGTSLPSTPTPMVPKNFSHSSPQLPPPVLDEISAKKRFMRPAPMILVNSTSTTGNEVIEPQDEKGVYDSSHKRRVPSWCDRILWKTTIAPGTIDDADDHVEVPGDKSRSKVGQFLVNTFLPNSARTIRAADSNSAASTPTNGTPNISLSKVSGIRPATPLRGSPSRARSKDAPQSRSMDGEPSSSRTSRDQHVRRSMTTFSPPPTAPLPGEPTGRSTVGSETSATSNPSTPDRPHSAAIWRFIPSFLTPNSQAAVVENPFVPDLPRLHRGDVVCIAYDTLDDRGMRRLEGRSDHRPVIGSYLVYL